MIWNLIRDDSTPIEAAKEQELGPWWPSNNDGFGLPFVAVFFGYQPDTDRDWELLPPANSPRIQG